MLKAFDRKFGEGFIGSVPTSPGVYLVYDARGELIYVGKAKNLRRRLGQYRNAKRRKKHAKMRAIVADADRVEFEGCESELEALLLENRLIQLHRPKWNIAGAFHFLYPLVGLHQQHGFTFLCYTTRPELFPEFHFHGTFRSRDTTRETFRALGDLLKFVATPVARSRIFGKEGFGKRDRYSEILGFRAIPDDWVELLGRFLEGVSREAVESLVLSLVDAPAARRSPKLVQKNLNWLKYFWKHEAVRLREVRRSTGFSLYPVPQSERDRLFLEHLAHKLHPSSAHGSSRPARAASLT